MSVASGLVIGSVDRSLVEALRAKDVEAEIVEALPADGGRASPDLVCVAFSSAAGASAPIDAVRERFPHAAIVIVVPARDVAAGAIVARDVDAELVTLPVDVRRAGDAVDRVLARRGRRREIEALLQRLRGLDPLAAAGVEAIGRDREAKARALDEALAFRSNILANLAHEVRTPLTVLRGYVDLLDEDFANVLDADQLELLRGTRASGAQLVSVFQGLVDLARAETGGIEARPASVFLPELLREVGREASPALEGRPVRFFLDVDRRLGWVRTEPEWLRQIVSCLLSNATKFTREGEVRLAARVLDEPAVAAADDESNLLRSPTSGPQRVEIEISDTGRGIAAEEQARIFEAFHQADSSSTRAHEGLGIGLTVVRELAREIGAELDLESRPGAGTRVRVRIPFDRIRERSGPEPARRAALAAGSPAATRGSLGEIARLHRLMPASVAEATSIALDALDRIIDARASLFAVGGGGAWRVVDATGEAAATARPPEEILERAAQGGRASSNVDAEDRWYAIAVRDVAGYPIGVLLCHAATLPEAETWAALQAAGGWLGLVHSSRSLAAEHAEVAAAISRSIKDPLGALLAYTQVLLRGLRGPLSEDQRTIVLRLEKGIHRAILAGLDLLDFERARGGRMQVTSRPFSFAHVIEHVLARHASALELARIEVSRDVAHGSDACLGDEIRTDRAVSAVLRAFVDGSLESDKIAIVVRSDARHVTCEIRGRVGESRPFTQALGEIAPRLALDDTLGLALARVGIEAQGGHLSLRVEEPDLVVVFALPRAVT